MKYLNLTALCFSISLVFSSLAFAQSSVNESGSQLSSQENSDNSLKTDNQNGNKEEIAEKTKVEKYRFSGKDNRLNKGL